MSSLTPVSPPANINLYCSHEVIFMSLERMDQGSSMPDNVLEGVNPYQYMPAALPDDIWYFIRSGKKKDSKHGFWKARGEACEIFSNSAIIGWRTTLDFYEGRVPHEQRTNWVMQEYKITQKRLCSGSNPKESSLLCKVFSSELSPNQEMRHKLGHEGNAGGNHIHPKSSVVQDAGSTTGQGCMSEFQARNSDDNTRALAAAGGLSNIPIEDVPDIDYFSRGDYLELDDLVDPGSRSSSSDNTSCMSLTSDECFDSLALLQDLEKAINQDEQVKDANFKFNVVASVKPNEVVLPPAKLGNVTLTFLVSPQNLLLAAILEGSHHLNLQTRNSWVKWSQRTMLSKARRLTMGMKAHRIPITQPHHSTAIKQS